MGATTRRRLRDRKKITPQNRDRKFEKLRVLECFDEIHKRVCIGWSTDMIAKYVHEDRGEARNQSREALARMIRRYREAVPESQLVQPHMPARVEKAMDRMDQGMDELDELQKLYKLQMGRIQIDLEKEQTIGKLFPTMTSEIKVAKDILKDFAQLKMDLGLEKRHLGQVDLEARLIASVEQQYGEDVKTIVEDSSQRRRLLSVAEKVIDVEEDSDEDDETASLLAALLDDDDFEDELANELDDEEAPDKENSDV